MRSVLLSKFSLFQEQFSSRILRAMIMWRVSASPVSVNVCSQCHQYTITPKIEFSQKDLQTQNFPWNFKGNFVFVFCDSLEISREGQNQTRSQVDTRHGQEFVDFIYSLGTSFMVWGSFRLLKSYFDNVLVKHGWWTTSCCPPDFLCWTLNAG